MLKPLIITFLIFFTLFPVNLTFLPLGLSSRHILAICGSVLWFLSIIGSKRRFYSKISLVFFLSILVSMWSLLCTLIFNIGNDYTFVKHPITLATIFFSVYICIYTLKHFEKELNFELIAKYYIYALLLQSILVLMQFFSPSIADALLSIQRLSERQLNISGAHLEKGSRFIGFGLFFYTASFFYGTALILIAFLIKHKSSSSIQSLKLYLLYFFLFLIGMGLSRSTIIGFVASLLIFVFPINSYFINLKKTLTTGFYILVFSITILAILKLNSKSLLQFQNLFDNAFDFLISYFNTGSLESNSAKGTLNMFVLPKQLHTYFFGTGLYETYTSVKDFNYSDIGYLRLLYYFGIPGLVLFIWTEIKLLKYAFKKSNLTPIYYSMLIILLVTNIKGITTLAVISMLFAGTPAQNKGAKK